MHARWANYNGIVKDHVRDADGNRNGTQRGGRWDRAAGALAQPVSDRRCGDVEDTRPVTTANRHAGDRFQKYHAGMVIFGFSAAGGNSGLALGNAIVPNIANVALILAATALFSPATLELSIVIRDLPAMIGQTIVQFMTCYGCINPGGSLHVA